MKSKMSQIPANESGRTMLEMLAIMALIILLTMAALYGIERMAARSKADAVAKVVQRLVMEKRFRLMGSSANANTPETATSGNTQIEIKDGSSEGMDDVFVVSLAPSNATLCEELKRVSFLTEATTEEQRKNAILPVLMADDCPQNLKFYYSKQAEFDEQKTSTGDPNIGGGSNQDPDPVSCEYPAKTCDSNGNPTSCVGGYYLNGNTCIQCGNRQISSAGSTSCTTCGAGKTNNSDHTACEDCAPGDTNCGCSGSTPYADGIGGCRGGTNCSSLYPNSSTTVREGYQIGETDCYCVSGYYWNEEEEKCLAHNCPVNSSPIKMPGVFDSSARVRENCWCDPNYNTTVDGWIATYNPNQGDYSYYDEEKKASIHITDNQGVECELASCYKAQLNDVTRAALREAQAKTQSNKRLKWCRIYDGTYYFLNHPDNGTSGGVSGLASYLEIVSYNDFRDDEIIELGTYNGITFYTGEERSCFGPPWFTSYTWCLATGGRMVKYEDLVRIGICPENIGTGFHCSPFPSDIGVVWLDNDCGHYMTQENHPFYRDDCYENAEKNSHYAYIFRTVRGYMKGAVKVGKGGCSGDGLDIKRTLCVRE